MTCPTCGKTEVVHQYETNALIIPAIVQYQGLCLDCETEFILSISGNQYYEGWPEPMTRYKEALK